MTRLQRWVIISTGHVIHPSLFQIALHFYSMAQSPSMPFSTLALSCHPDSLSPLCIDRYRSSAELMH